MIVPAAVHVPAYTRQVVHQEAPTAHPVVALATPAATATHDVQTQRVIASYQRYGQPSNNTTTDRDVA